VRGEPIVCTPQDAYKCFIATDMDALVIEDFVLFKSEMAETITDAQRAEYLAKFELD
jgi:carbamoyltransferase